MNSFVKNLLRFAHNPVSYSLVIAFSVITWGRFRRPASDTEVHAFLDRLQLVASSPLAFGAFALLLCGWAYSIHALHQLQSAADAAKELPDGDQLKALRVLTRQDLSQIPRGQRFDFLRKRFRLVGYLSTLAALIILGVLATYAWTLPESEIRRQLGYIDRRLDAIVVMLEDELARKSLSFEARGRTIDQLVSLVADPPPISERAKELAKSIKQDDPPYARALKAIVEGRPDDALKLLEQDRKYHLESLHRNYRTTGDTYYYQSDFDEALKWYREALGFRPNDTHSLIGIGNCLAYQGNWDDALANYDAIIVDSSVATGLDHVSPLDLAGIHNNRGFVLTAVGDSKGGLEAFDQSVRMFERLVDTDAPFFLRSSLALSVTNRGIAFHRLLNFSAAIADYTKAVSLWDVLVHQDGRIELVDKLARALNDRGNAETRLFQRDAAIVDYSNAIAIYETLDVREVCGRLEDTACSLYNRAFAYIKDERHALAIKDLTRGINLLEELASQKCGTESSRRFAGYLNNRSVALRGAHDLRASVADSDRAIEMQSAVEERDHDSDVSDELATFVSNRGTTLCAQGRFAEALSSYERAITIRTELVSDGRRVEFVHQLAKLIGNRGQCLEAQGNVDEALRDYDATIEKLLAIRQEQRDIETNCDLANAYSCRCAIRGQLGRHEDALADCDNAIAILSRLADEIGREMLGSELSVSFNNRSIVHSLLAQVNKAIQDMTEAINLREMLLGQGEHVGIEHDLARSHNFRAYLNRRQGNTHESIRDYSRTIAILGPLVKERGLAECVADWGTALNSRGVIFGEIGDADSAIQDFDSVIEVYTDLVNNKGRLDLVKDLATSRKNRELAILQKIGRDAGQSKRILIPEDKEVDSDIKPTGLTSGRHDRESCRGLSLPKTLSPL